MADNSRYSRLAKNSIIFAIANFGSSILRFLIVPFYTFYLSTAEYGTVDTLTTTVSLLMPVMLLAIQEATLRFTLDNKYDKLSVLQNALLIFCIGSIFFLLGYFPFSHFEVFDGLWWPFYILLLSSASNNILLNYTRGVGKSVVFMISGILNTVAMLLCNIVMIAHMHKGIQGYVFSLVIGYLTSSVFLLIFINPLKVFQKNEIDVALLKDMLKYSIPLIPTAAMWWIMNVADKYTILFFCGASFTGIYAISHKVPTIISMLYSIFQQAWQISAVEESSSLDSGSFYNVVYNMFFRILFTAASVIIFFIKPLILFVVESSYSESWKYAPVLLISAVFSSMAGFLGVNYVVSKKTSGALVTSAIGALTNILLNLVFVPKLGLQGAAIATLIGFYTVWLVRATLMNGGIEIQQDFKTIHILLLITLAQTVLLLVNIRYAFLFQIICVIAMVYFNRNILLKSTRLALTFIGNLKRKGE